jgi:hypothetical protein
MSETRSFDQDTLYSLLPSVYRLRDALQGKPLYALMGVIAEQVAVLEENLDQLYDDQFIETCAEWVVPYIGDLIGVRDVHTLDLPAVFSARAQVANTLAYRRRKGTASVLEQLARDATGWAARAVEFFQLLVGTQYLNHQRPHVASIDVRDWKAREWLETPFTGTPRRVDVRRIASGRGLYNVPNVGIFLWRVSAYPATRVTPYDVDARRYLVNPLGSDMSLYNLPVTETEITHLAEPENVPLPISRRRMAEAPEAYYGPDRSICLYVDGQPVDKSDVWVCNLADGSAAWTTPPADALYRIDPKLGRLVTPGGVTPSRLRISYHYGFSADLGGGEYSRDAVHYEDIDLVIQVPADHGRIADAIAAAGSNSAIVEIGDNHLYKETLDVTLAPSQHLVLAPEHAVRTDEGGAANSAGRSRPVLQLGSEMVVRAGRGSELTLDGIAIDGGTLRIQGNLARLRLRHCTLAPRAAAPSLVVESPGTQVEVEDAIVGGLRLAAGATAQIRSSIVDATVRTGVAYAAPGGDAAGGSLTIEKSTVIGKLWTTLLERASNCIFVAQLSQTDPWPAPVLSQRVQQGCVRFCFLPLESRVPRRYRCRPESADEAGRVQPQFVSLRYGDASYCQLSQHCPDEIWRGAEDEAEMGVFHDLYQPQRVTNLRVRLDEYLRFGLEAGVFLAS